ncbi:MAG: F0F1 ATP synthase subunit epsilon [Myxococcales bacterium]|nr:F0F1 ATP synthase subunit epsilon [Myxococcales bacterium]
MGSFLELKVLLPHRVFLETPDVLRVVAETPEGSVGLLPNRLDCVAALAPGIFSYETRHGGELYVAVDGGVLVKTGREVVVAVRRAIGGADLGHLRAAVDREFLTLTDQEKSKRQMLAKLETGFLKRLTRSFHDR